MKPLLSRIDDTATLEDLGRASVQIVHDLKNQLNGLKLYATFLRKRMEKTGSPADEQDTIGKLISGLDRAASDLGTIVEYGRGIELKKQAGVDLQKVIRNICSDLNTAEAPIVCNFDSDSLTGEFDPTRLADALKWISVGSLKYRNPESPITLSESRDEKIPNTVNLKWTGMKSLEHDPFRSFAGGDEIRMSLAVKIIEAHSGSLNFVDSSVSVALPIST